MKRLLALLLALAMVLGTMAALAEAAETEETSVLPAVGDVIEGFEVTEIRTFGLIGADLVLFEHQKTGAKLLYIANDDTNRAFQLGFPTRMENDKGIPHVFEHGTTSGSKKYPSTSLWMNVSMQTYNTYINAHTADATTWYPIASLSEAQLLKLADYYTDLCFNPMIMEDESIYRTEAWRYEMTNADAELTYNGTVYSEMLGAMTLQRAALLNANKATFPGASITYNSGGNPDDIPDMTWEDLKDYHNKYYHPSNCLAILYGDIEDYAAFLKLLDEAFAPYEKKEFSFEEPAYTRITEPVTASYKYPMAEGTDTANQTEIIYYILCPGMKDDVEQETLIDHACEMLGDDNSALMVALQNEFPAGSFSIGREVAAPDDAIIFQAIGMNEGDEERFREIVDEQLAAAALAPFPDSQVDEIVTALKFNAKLAAESSDPVGTFMSNFNYDYATTGNVFKYQENYDALENIEEENSEGLLSGAIARWLVTPELYTLTVTSPDPGKQEEHDAALAAKLAEIKAGMTEEEIAAIVEATNTEPAAEDNTELLASLVAVTVPTLPEEIREYEAADTMGEDGVRRIEVTAGVDGISYAMLDLDAAALPQEDIHYMRLFTRLLGHMDTDEHGWEDIATLTDRYLYDSTFGVFVSGWKNEWHPYLVAEWYALDEDLETGYALVEEILFHTQFTDLERLKERIGAQKNAMRSQINQSAYSVLMSRQMAITNEQQRYYSYLNFLEYYAFLEELEQKMEEHPEEIAAALERVQQFFANRSGAIAGAAGNEKSLELNRKLSDAFFAKLDNTAREAAEYDLPVPAKKEALIFDSNIQFNIITAEWNAIDPEADGVAYSALGSLATDKLLTPVLRDKMGVYTPFCGSNQDELYLLTYRDPNVAETFTYFDTLPDGIDTLEVTQADVDNYIVSTYSGLAMPQGELAGAISTINNRINGVPEDNTLQAMRTLKATTTETMKTFAGYIADLLNTGVRGTAGGAAAINANAEMYDAILNPFNVKDMSEAAYDDLAEDNERYAYIKAAMDEGFMAPLSDTHFGTDDNATVGDLLGAIYLMIGGPTRDPEACKELLAANNLMDADTDLNEPLTEGYTCELFTALGAAVSTDTPDQVMTRADLAEFLMAE